MFAENGDMQSISLHVLFVNDKNVFDNITGNSITVKRCVKFSFYTVTENSSAVKRYVCRK